MVVLLYGFVNGIFDKNSWLVMQFTEKHYEILKDIVYEECGIDLHEGKLELLKARVAKRMRLLKLNTVSEYVKLVKKDEDEFINFIDAVTTNHTFFFRENHHCEFLLNAIDNSNYLKIWSAASSSGEEPYSIAIQLLDKRYRFEIFASDISNTMLRLARRGIYLKDKAKLIPLFISATVKAPHFRWYDYYF
ncbi:MAG: CheR family methyltransferase [Thermodesulfobacteriota bacterium]|nr:CheR family methyltransferase [Thermodesulfobacteriota bacterium]